VTRLKDQLNSSINWATRKKARHNHALRELLNLSKYIEDFFTKYRLLKGATAETISKNIGQIRIDATEITHLIETRIKTTENIEGKNLQPLVKELHDDFDELKRFLFTRTLSDKVLHECVSKIDMVFKNLLATISDMAYK
jgi:hypothetical protein